MPAKRLRSTASTSASGSSSGDHRSGSVASKWDRLARPVLRGHVTRPLKAYAFDPTHGRALGNYMTIDVRYEPELARAWRDDRAGNADIRV